MSDEELLERVREAIKRHRDPETKFIGCCAHNEGQTCCVDEIGAGYDE